MVELQEPAEPLLAFDRFAVRPQRMITGREQQHVVFSLKVSFLSIMLTKLGQDMRWRLFSPRRIVRDKLPKFTDRTQRSANAFKLGERAGSLMGSTPADLIPISLKATLNFESRSWMR